MSEDTKNTPTTPAQPASTGTEAKLDSPKPQVFTFGEPPKVNSNDQYTFAPSPTKSNKKKKRTSTSPKKRKTSPRASPTKQKTSPQSSSASMNFEAATPNSPAKMVPAGRALLSDACRSNDINSVKDILRKETYKPTLYSFLSEHSPLHIVYTKKSSEIVDLLLKHFVAHGKETADDEKDSWSMKTRGIHMIEAAIDQKDPKMVQQLLDLGANPTGRCIDLCPLVLAVQRNLPEIVEILLKHPDVNPNLDANTETELFPLHLACRQDNAKIVSMLLKHPQIDVNQRSGGTTALHHACRGNLEIVKLLLAVPSLNPNGRSSDAEYTNVTPLHVAMKFEQLEIFKLLIADPRIDPNLVNDIGETVLHGALGNEEFLPLILENPKVKFTPIKWDNSSILVGACRSGSLECVNAIVSDPRLEALTPEIIEKCLLGCKNRRNFLKIGARLCHESGVSPIDVIGDKFPNLAEQLQRSRMASRSKSARK